MGIRISLVKSQGGRDQTDTFRNDYLFTGSPDFKSAAAEDAAIELADKERLIYTSDTNYVRAIISDVSADGKPIKGFTRSFPLDQVGAFALPEGDKVAGSHIVAAVERAASFGRNGISFYRHCITADEFAAWQNDRTVPARFTAPVVDPAASGSTIWGWISEAVGGGELTPALPDSVGDIPVTLRPIVVFRFGGFRFNDPKRPKKSLAEQQREAAQQQVNEAGRTARELLEDLADGIDPTTVPLIVELVSEVVQILLTLPLPIRAKIKWPKALGTKPPLALPGG